jgi:uncharacterized membrane protein
VLSENAKEDSLGLERVVLFSDAVFAIAITLLILEVRAPHLPEGAGNRDLVGALFGLLPKLIGYAVSFMVIGSMWIEHHRVFRYIGQYDDGLLWRNLVLLLTVGLMPFPTAVFSENHTLGVGLAVYAACLGAVGVAKVWVWRHASAGRRLLRHDVSKAVIGRISRRSWAVPVTCGVTGTLGALGVPFAYMGFAFIPAVAWLFDRVGRQERRPTTA